MASKIVPPEAEHAAVLHGLVRKRAEVAGLIEHRKAELRDLQDKLSHVDATIHLFNPDVRIDFIRPKRDRPAHAALHGELIAAVFDALRSADVPLTSRDIAAAVVSARGLDEDDRALEMTMARRVRACLRLHRLKGQVSTIEMGDGPQGWLVVGGRAANRLAERASWGTQGASHAAVDQKLDA